MLSRLHIKNYVLIDSLEVVFPEGLVIITGQTGAGKSIVLGALSLLTGAKADASAISADAENCVVEAEFFCSDKRVRSILEEADVEWDGGNLLIRRVVARSGRSRSFINDCPVPVSVLQEISGLIVDIHSQHKSLLLTDRQFQLDMLDSYAGNSELLSACSSMWKSLCANRSELQNLKSRLGVLKADEDYNRTRWERLEAAKIRDGELAELEEEQKRLANAEQIKELFGSSLDVLSADDSCGRLGVVEALKESRRQLDRVSAFVPEASGLAERMESARLEIADILDEVESLDSAVDSSEERLQTVEDRMSLIYGLFSSYGCSNEAELIDCRDRLNSALFDTSSLEEKISSLESSIRKDESAFASVCDELHKSRAAAAPSFSAAVTSSLHFLELDRALFEVSLAESPASGTGNDRVQFLFSASGIGLQDVSKCASGGEISRIMLCLKALMAKFIGMPTLFFDEIDSGVSGSVADRMGQMICDMGRDMQVFSITHLPQVAAKGNAHFVVSKNETADGRIVSGITEVSGRDRIMEIARLLSGSTISEAAVANAESLLKGC